jgi:hypothetical protein
VPVLHRAVRRLGLLAGQTTSAQHER